MKTLLIFLIVLFGTLFLINIILLAIAFVIKKKAFGSRCDKNPLLKYFTAEDFGLCAKSVDISCEKGKYLRGVVYKKEGLKQNPNLIIFCHGMGPGQVAYTTEIAYFCNLGYTVFAPDYHGCNLSDGKSIKSFGSGTRAVVSAIIYAQTNLAYKNIYLVGHSWGGYSALCAASETASVSKVVAISAPDKPEKAIYSVLAGVMPRFFARILYPYISLVSGDKSAAEAAKWSGARILLVHGENDATVGADNAVYYRADGPHIQKYLAAGKGHNPYNTAAAEGKLRELSTHLSSAPDDAMFFENFDFTAATREDGEVMNEIARFLASDP